LKFLGIPDIFSSFSADSTRTAGGTDWRDLKEKETRRENKRTQARTEQEKGQSRSDPAPALSSSSSQIKRCTTHFSLLSSFIIVLISSHCSRVGLPDSKSL